MRTNFKNKNTYVMLNEDAEDCFAVFKLIKNHRITGLVDQVIQQINLKQIPLNDHKQKFYEMETQHNEFITEWAKYLPTLNEKQQKLWVELREFVGKYPMLDSLNKQKIKE
ncbi:MAG: hypothetical protein ACLUDD_08030 [Lactobacillus kalixensis]